MYAILDIETTGGKYNEEGITEIAIYKHDGHKIVDQFISLINPERPIQPFVVNLTGINSKMLKNAPKFYEIAKRIIEITTNCIIVAHNADFDCRILKTEFKRLGYDFDRPSICTVSLSKHILKDMPSYSLGKLVRALGIPISDRHRAAGDAQATVKLFELLLDKDLDKTIIKQNIKKERSTKFDTKLLDIINNLPNALGIYFIHDNDGVIIYIGKSKNIKNSVIQQFSNNTAKTKKILSKLSAITFEKTGNELITSLKENEALKIHKPLFNRHKKQSKFTHGLYPSTEENTYIKLSLHPVKTQIELPITTFTNYKTGLYHLNKFTEEFLLCKTLNGLNQSSNNCNELKPEQCACITHEPATQYNARVNQLIAKHTLANKTFIIIDKGRVIDERSIVFIKKGVFKGTAFYNLNHQINNVEIIEKLITPMSHNDNAIHYIKSYLRKPKHVKLTYFD